MALENSSGIEWSFYPGSKIFYLEVQGEENNIINGIAEDLSLVEVNPSSYVNVYDDKFHVFMASWTCSASVATWIDNKTYPVAGMLGFDNFIFSTSDSNYARKRKPLSFAYNAAGSATKLSFGGFLPTRNSAISDSTANYEAINCLNATISDIVIWDTLLPFEQEEWNDDMLQDPGGAWGAAVNGGDVFTNASLSPYKDNIVAKWDFVNNASISSLSAIDKSGASVGGSQTFPTTGHTLWLFQTTLSGDPTYTIYDSNYDNETLNHANGILQFVNEENKISNVGIIFYELGIVVFDDEYILGSNSGLPFIQTLPVSGMCWDCTSSIQVNYVSFDSQKYIERMLINSTAEKDEFNITQNKTGIIQNTAQQLLKDNQGSYPTTIGYYNSLNDLIAVAKVNHPIRKDSDHIVNFNACLDF